MGEGAGCIVLEEYEHAKSRGAKIYAEILGYGLSADAFHITAPSSDGDGGYRAMKAALENGNLNASDINYINAHGTSTPLGDQVEFNAVKKLFKNNLKNLAMSSTKSSTGHLLGASGAIEAIFSILAITDKIIPPTLNLYNPSEGCEEINLVPFNSIEKETNYALSNSFGFGGTNVSLIFKNT
jgi:3-oxoacyl-[acyl-carrier-protein] synthase II